MAQKENSERSYLKSVHLKGYKSIIDTRIDFRDGLNIIIGKNASGKTNFLEFLNLIINENFEDLAEFSGKLKWSNRRGEAEMLLYRTSNSIEEEDLLELPEIEHKLETDYEYDSVDDLGWLFHTNDLRLKKIHFGIPTEQPLLSTPYTIEINHKNFFLNLVMEINKLEGSNFVRQTVARMILQRRRIGDQFPELQEKVRSFITENFEPVKQLNQYLSRLTPIQKIRLAEDFNVFKNDKQWTISNLFFEFKVDGYWQPYNSLSDGTKRLFYIISEVVGFNTKENKDDAILLIEEPELGIHPHQLHQLMVFIKEMSKNRQIIISTHSPKVLDILEKDELDRIIIAKSEGRESGTKLYHLTEEQIKKAHHITESDGLYLSDYWMYAGLED